MKAYAEWMLEVIVLCITFGSILFHSLGLSLVIVALISACMAVAFFIFFPSRKTIVVAAIIAFSCFTGAITVSFHDTVVPRGFYGQRIVTAKILSLERTLDKVTLTLRDQLYKKKIRVTTSAQEMLPGDTVTLSGAVHEPEDFITDTGRLFQYKQYLASKNIFGVMYAPSIVHQKNTGRGIMRIATIARHASAEILRQYVSFPYDGVVAGMTLGDRGGIPKEVETLFRDTGILHVLVLSGYNITLLAGALLVLLQRLNKYIRLGVVGCSIGMLVLISGAGIASIRAGFMGGIGLLSLITLTEYKPLRALCLTYIVVFFYSPLLIFYDPGFHLSFIATFSMVLIIPRLQKLAFFIPQVPFIDVRSLVVLGTMFPFLLLPYTMYFSGAVSLAVIPANIVLALVAPIIMILGIAVICSSVIPVVATFFGMILSFVVEKTIAVVELFATLTTYNTPYLSGWSVVGIYSMFCLFFFNKELRWFIVQLRNSLLPGASSSGR